MSDWKPGDIANGHVLGEDFVWRSVEVMAAVKVPSGVAAEKKQRGLAKWGSAAKKAYNDAQAANEDRKEHNSATYGTLAKKSEFGNTSVEIYESGYVRVGMLLTTKSPFEKLRSIEYKQISQDKSAGGRAVAGALSFGASYLTSNEQRLMTLVIATDRKVHTITSNSGKGFGRQEDNKGIALEAAGNAVLGVIQGSTIQKVTIEDAQPSVPQQSLAEQIRSLAELRDQGILTDAEFDAKKKQLLGL